MPRQATPVKLDRALRLLEYLRQQPRQSLELAALLGVSQQAVQRTLASIRAADVWWATLVSDRRGKQIWHHIADFIPAQQRRSKP